MQLHRGQAFAEVQQVAQGQIRLLADGGRVLLEALEVAAVHRILQQVDGLRVVGVSLAAGTDAEEAAHRWRWDRRAEGHGVTLERRLLQTG
ncbi:hypothetical protein D3C72_1144000 [compost metagenome]